MVKVGFISLGCAKNQVDLERLAGSLSEKKFLFCADSSKCDIMIVNTCGFIKDAVQEAIDTILQVKSELKKGAKLIVFGCMSERYKDEFASCLPEVDFFAGVGNEAMQSVLDYIQSGANLEESKRYIFNAPYYAYLKIAEGCSNRCSYCAIPSIRGPHKSISSEQLLKETRELVSSGAKEIIVVSQDITKYGSDSGETDISGLLELLASVFNDTYFRLMYLNPDGVTKKLIDTVKKHKNIIKYFDIPVQSASDKILKSMNRHYNSRKLEEVFSMIREELPDSFIRTTAIVGFPGETDEDFSETLHFFEKYKPDYAGFFAYSPEDGTKAAVMDGSVDKKNVRERLRLLQSVQKKNTRDKLKSISKNEIVCFVEKTNDDFDFILEGRALFQAPEIDGITYVTDAESVDGSGPYAARIVKISYPDVYVRILRRA